MLLAVLDDGVNNQTRLGEGQGGDVLELAQLELDTSLLVAGGIAAAASRRHCGGCGGWSGGAGVAEAAAEKVCCRSGWGGWSYAVRRGVESAAEGMDGEGGERRQSRGT